MKLLRLIGSSLLFAICVACFTACGTGGTPPVVTLGDTEIIVGTSKVHALAGFNVSLPGGQGSPYGKLDGRSYLQDLLSVDKDGKTYAYSYIYNPERAATDVLQCIIYKLTLYSPEERPSWSEEVQINGVNFWGLDAEGIKDAMSDYKLKRESDASLTFSDGAYNYFFMLNTDGGIQYITVEMTIK